MEVGRSVIKRIVCSFIVPVLLLSLVLGSGCTNAPSQGLPGKIVFVSDIEGVPQICVMDSDGSNSSKLGSWAGIPNTFRWSPDGERIAFIDADGWLCLIDADGGNLSKLAEIPSYSISWSPDGGKIAAGCFDYDIYTVDVGTGELQNLTNTPDIVESLPSWSRDSQKIAFAVFNPPYFDISLMDADGSNQTTIIGERGICEELVWSPDGKKVGYTWYSEDAQGSEGICRDICLVNIQDGSKANLTNSPKFDDRDIAWSPDGKRITFSSRRQVVDLQIYVMNADGNQVSKLTTGDSSNYFPSWSPDGKKIVFTSGKDICIIDADGSNVVNLTHTPDTDDYLAIWAPQ